MLGNLLLILTTIIYIALAVFVIQPVDATGERLVGWGIISFSLLAAYIISSLHLTISIYSKGLFSWVANTAALQKFAAALIWFGLVAGVVICTIAKTDFPKGHQSTELPALLSYPFYFGAAWLPLLMLVPYTILLNPAWQQTLLPIMFKIPLVTGCIIGYLLLAAPNIISSTGLLDGYKNESDIKKSLQQIEQETSITRLLMLTDKKENEQVRMAAMYKIKTQPNLEEALMLILEQENPWFFIWVYSFLAENKMEHQERFIELVNKSIPRLASTVYHEALQNPWKGEGTYHLLHAEPLFRLLDTKFKDSSAAFRNNILLLQDKMNTQPAKRDGDKRRFDEALNNYRLAIKNWLDKN